MTIKKKGLVSKIPKEFGSKLDLVVSILHTHLNRENKDLLFKTLKEIQKVNGLSVEYIKSLILTSDKKEKEDNQKRKEIYSTMEKFVKLLKREDIEIELAPITYRTWRHSIDLTKDREQGVIRKFKI